MNDQLGVSLSCSKSTDMHETSNQPRPSSEIEGIMDKEDDVKVCDICGDAGQEDLLAICSRCTDGAQHTYCMQTMLDKLPVGDWLCEDCMFKEACENKKEHTKIQVETFLNEDAQNDSSIICSEILLKKDGALLKPSSFKNSNAKPRVKVLHGAVPLAEHAFTKNASEPTRKAGLTREMVIFASFETEKGGCNSFELDNKKSSVHIQRIEDMSVERDKELCGIERRNSSEVQVADTRTCRGLVDGDISGYIREDPLHSSKSSASASSNGLNLEYQNRFRISQGGNSHVNVASDYHKPRYDLVKNDPVFQHGNHLNLEFSSQPDITKVVTSSTTLNKTMYNGGNTVCCQKCNQAGHLTHLCSFDKHHVSAKLFADRLSREDAKSNKWKASTEIIISKQEELKNTTIKDMSKELPVPRFCSSANLVNKESPPNCFRKTYFQEGRTNATRSFIFEKSEPIVHPHKMHHKVGAGRLNPFDNNISMEFEMKSSGIFFPSTEACFPNILKASVIPKLDFFWQGDFEVLRSGRLPEYCDGLQAHFSSYASGLVIEAAKKFPPDKVKLEEVPCLSSWPNYFHGNRAKEHNIDVFFFAKDIKSYSSSYCKLLDNMLKYDLALKGNFGDFELLIFPSYKLPENFQRWNRLFFLWGIFKGRRPSSIEMLSNVQDDPCNSTMDVKSLVEDLPIPEASNFKRKFL